MSSSWQVMLYETPRGRCPVADFITAQPKKDQAVILAELDDLQRFGPFPRGNKLRPLRAKLWELRFRTSRGAVRIIFVRLPERRLLLLHAFLKKVRKTPKGEMDLALERLREYLARN